MSDAWLGFLGGVLTALIGGLIASLVQRNYEASQKMQGARLDTYWRLLELSQTYFWVASAEGRGEEPDPDMLQRCRSISWELADKLRTFDQVEHLDEVLEVLFSQSIRSANERANRLDSLLEKYGALVNPRYVRAIQKISRENLLAHGPGKNPPSNAPGAWQYRR